LSVPVDRTKQSCCKKFASSLRGKWGCSTRLSAASSLSEIMAANRAGTSADVKSMFSVLSWS
jgi:hypothetical protein